MKSMLIDGLNSKKSVAKMANLLRKNGWIANHDGNVSLRLSCGSRFIATPTAISKCVIMPYDLVTVNIEGKFLNGRKKYFPSGICILFVIKLKTMLGLCYMLIHYMQQLFLQLEKVLINLFYLKWLYLWVKMFHLYHNA